MIYLPSDYSQIALEDDFYIHHKTTSINTKKNFTLHHHPCPEIHFFVSGKASFVYEGVTYLLSPYDIMLIPPNTLHQPIPEINIPFTRYVFNIFPSFFDKMNCPEYEKMFQIYSSTNAKIPGEVVKKTNIINILDRLMQYSDDLKNTNQPIIYNILYELLYVIDSITTQRTFNEENTVVQGIIGYINENYRYLCNLDEISKALHYSKSHMSMLFRKNVGMTIHEYIILKRLNQVEKLYKKGKSLSAACVEAGFSSYNNFSYAYKLKYGVSPKEGFKNKISHPFYESGQSDFF